MFRKWDIIYTSRFPESVQCRNRNCGRHFTISEYSCPHCGCRNYVSNIIGKIRPILLWLDKSKWFESMAFAIPLSCGRIYENDYNQPISLNDYVFLHSNQNRHRPMRAIIHQATRVDGNVLSLNKKIGRITNAVVQQKIENKLLEWIFG